MAGRAGPGRGPGGQDWSCRTGRPRSRQPEASQEPVGQADGGELLPRDRRAGRAARGSVPRWRPRQQPRPTPGLAKRALSSPRRPRRCGRGSAWAFRTAPNPGRGSDASGSPAAEAVKGACVQSTHRVLQHWGSTSSRSAERPHSGAPGHPRRGDRTRRAPACSGPFLQARMRLRGFPVSLAVGWSPVVCKRACVMISQPPSRQGGAMCSPSTHAASWLPSLPRGGSGRNGRWVGQCGHCPSQHRDPPYRPPQEGTHGGVPTGQRRAAQPTGLGVSAEQAWTGISRGRAGPVGREGPGLSPCGRARPPLCVSLGTAFPREPSPRVPAGWKDFGRSRGSRWGTRLSWSRHLSTAPQPGRWGRDGEREIERAEPRPRGGGRRGGRPGDVLGVGDKAGDLQGGAGWPLAGVPQRTCPES